TASEITEGAQRVEELGGVHRRSAVEGCRCERLDEGRGPRGRLGERHVHTFDVGMLAAYHYSNTSTNELGGTGEIDVHGFLTGSAGAPDVHREPGAARARARSIRSPAST